MASIVDPDPDIKRRQKRDVPRTLHLYHRCQDDQPAPVALCGRRRRSRLVVQPARGEFPTETCVVCIDLHPTCARCKRGVA